MNIAWGAILIALGLFAWLGQSVSAYSPKLAARMGLTEPESDVDPAFYADVRGEAVWDSLVDWTLPAAGVLLILGIQLWVYFGLIGGGMYLYFAGRGIAQRHFMQRSGIRIGNPKTVTSAYVFLSLWGLIALITIVMAVAAFPIPLP